MVVSALCKRLEEREGWFMCKKLGTENGLQRIIMRKEINYTVSFKLLRAPAMQVLYFWFCFVSVVLKTHKVLLEMDKDSVALG